MKYNFAEIPSYRNDWDELEDAILEAKEKNKSVIVPVPTDKSPSAYRQNIRQAMRGRGININTICSSDVIFVWFRSLITENTEGNAQ